MAAITAGVIAAGSVAYGANRQSSAAKDASRAQARGVEGARADTEAATNRARAALTGGYYPELAQTMSPQGFAPQTPMGAVSAQISQQSQPPALIPNPKHDRGIDRRNNERMAEWQASQQAQQPILPGSRPMGSPQMGPQAIGQQPQMAFQAPETIYPTGQPPQQSFSMPQVNDPRSDLMQGVQSNLQFTNQGFGQAQDTLSPLAQMAQPYLNEQYNLLGMGGDDAYQQAISRVSDPMRAEQERSILRNNAALGGVGGNVLAQLAEATRARTEANIGNRLGQLSAASSPSLSALQNISNLQLNRNLRMGDTMQGAGGNLANMEINRRQALANVELGQGSQMAQLSQNLGTANAGGAAYAAGNAPALSQGIMSGLSAYMGAGGSFGGGDPFGSRASGYSFSGDPFA